MYIKYICNKKLICWNRDPVDASAISYDSWKEYQTVGQ